MNLKRGIIKKMNLGEMNFRKKIEKIMSYLGKVWAWIKRRKLIKIIREGKNCKKDKKLESSWIRKWVKEKSWKRESNQEKKWKLKMNQEMNWKIEMNQEMNLIRMNQEMNLILMNWKRKIIKEKEKIWNKQEINKGIKWK